MKRKWGRIPFIFSEKREIPKFLRKPDNIESLEFEDIKFQTCVTGKPIPEIAWYMADKKLEPSDRIIYEQVRYKYMFKGPISLSVSLNAVTMLMLWINLGLQPIF